MAAAIVFFRSTGVAVATRECVAVEVASRDDFAVLSVRWMCSQATCGAAGSLCCNSSAG